MLSDSQTVTSFKACACVQSGLPDSKPGGFRGVLGFSVSESGSHSYLNYRRLKLKLLHNFFPINLQVLETQTETLLNKNI